MLSTRCLMLTVATALLLQAAKLDAQAVMEPPFGLHWGDSPEKLVAWSSEHQLNITISLPGKQQGLKILRISPDGGFLPGTKAAALEGHFLDGKLFELAVHYTDATASAETMEARFEELRKQISTEYGKLLTNQQQRTVKDQFVTRTQSFHREPVRGLFLLLAFTEVEDLLRQSKEARFSLIYRNDNFREQLEAALRKP